MDGNSLPIDIHCGKLLDWLVSRRHCGKDWQDGSLAIRAKINHAIQDMPEHPEILKLLSGTYINYFHCRRIVEIMKETEKDSKNFLGFYSSQRMKDWAEVCGLYERDAVYLAEAAQLLYRLVQYEVPGLRKQIAKANQTAEECGRKEEELKKQSREAEKAFRRECEKMGVDPDSPKSLSSQLLHLADESPAFLDQVAAKAKKLDQSAAYYSAFRQHLLRREEKEADLLPMLSYVRTLGNTTYYEWKHGKKPRDIEFIRLDVETEPEASEEIDFGDDIDFGGDDDGAIDFGDFSVEGSGVEGIEEVTADIGKEGTLTASEIADDGVARGKEAFSVLEHRATRDLFVRDLHELRAFLQFRLLDLGSESPADLLLASQASRHPRPPAADLGLPKVERCAADVAEILALLGDKYRRHLLEIRASPAYLERLVRELETKRNVANRCTRQAAASALRQQEATDSAVEMGPKLALLVERTKELQKQIENDISKKYQNRKVNIMGCMVSSK